MADAAGIILLSRESKNPYDLDYHADDCDEPDLWLDAETLIDLQDAADTLSCPACAYQYDLWSHIIESCGGASPGHRAFRAFNLEDYLKHFKPKMRTIDAQDYRDVEAVRAERARIRAQKEYNREQEAEAQRRQAK